MSYNGYKNWTQWNVSLWINNDEGLYHLAKESIDIADNRDHAVELMLDYLVNPEFMGVTHTPDGAKYTKTAIRAAMVGM